MSDQGKWAALEQPGWVCEHCGALNEQRLTADGAVYCAACGEYAGAE